MTYTDEDNETFSFDVTFEELSIFKGDCPINTKRNSEWAFHNLKWLETESNQMNSVHLVFYAPQRMKYVTGCVNIFVRHVKWMGQNACHKVYTYC